MDRQDAGPTIPAERQVLIALAQLNAFQGPQFVLDILFCNIYDRCASLAIRPAGRPYPPCLEPYPFVKSVGLLFGHLLIASHPASTTHSRGIPPDKTLAHWASDGDTIEVATATPHAISDGQENTGFTW